MATKREILTENIAAREQEIMFYDINIANYTNSLDAIAAKSDGDPDKDGLSEYRPKLVELLASEKRERAKAVLFLEAAQKQLADLPPEE